MRISDLNYELPEELIAQEPLPERDASRLLFVDRGAGAWSHRTIRELPGLLGPALWVVNDTRVLAARLKGHKPTGGRVELLLVERLGEPGPEERWLCMGRASKGLRAGTEVRIGDRLVAVVERGREGGMVEVRLSSDEPLDEVIAAVGEMPLPPYIRRPEAAADRSRYQTIFAREPGAAAAPTAGLHFNDRLIEALRAAGHQMCAVTLHVGPGTFAPVKVESLEQHPMHAEHYHIPPETAAAVAEARSSGRPVIAVGTTAVRALEAATSDDGDLAPGPGSTDLCIYPPYRFRTVDGLLTNFHLPRSTLLALVMALAGEDLVRSAYRSAVEERYRFFSYGDAMLIAPPTGPDTP